jgi:two-component system, chemotaxis family, sensor kinase CheA
MPDMTIMNTTMSDYLDPQNEELLQDFFVEAESQVELLEANILVLENDTGSRDAIDEIFRAAHTLKGAAATVQMTELAEFTHAVEDALDEIRSGHVSASGDLVDALLVCIDIIKEMLQKRREGSAYSEDVGHIVARLKSLVGRESPATAPEEPSPGPAVESPQPVSPASGPAPPGTEAAPDGLPVYVVSVSFDESNPMNSVGGIQVYAALKGLGTILKTDPELERLYEDEFFPRVDYYLSSGSAPGEIEKATAIPDVTTGATVTPQDGAGAQETVAPSPVAVASEAAEDPSAAAGGSEVPSSSPEEGVPAPGEKKTTSSVLRVDAARVDQLLNLVSETVINKASFNQLANEFGNALSEFGRGKAALREEVRRLVEELPELLGVELDNQELRRIRTEIGRRFGSLHSSFDSFEGQFKGATSKFRSNAGVLSRITGDLQEGVMRIRMVPISQVFSRFPRLVRDLSKSLGKSVKLELEGQDTELDKSVIEDLLDPLIHCVRNSIDHGIESREERIEEGKPEEGRLSMRASNEGNMIVIQVEDDGHGIDVESVKKKAVDRNIIHPNKDLSDTEAFNLIFSPGFSTAKSVTNVSGRGVGLDVVKRQIEKLNGTVSVWSERGMGTTFTMKIPLTLAIIQGLLVKVGTETYAIPITSIIDSHRIRPGDIRLLDNYEVFNLREDVISLLRLNRLFGIRDGEAREYYYVVIVGSGERRIGLLVDSLIGEEDVVIKPLKDHYTNAPGIAGANITGDGSVSLIVDVSQLLELGYDHERRERSAQVVG